MFGSWCQYVVDFDGDGCIDLIVSFVDVIGSVVYYLFEYGWKLGQVIYYSVCLLVVFIMCCCLFVFDIKFIFSVVDLVEVGVEFFEVVCVYVGLLVVIELQNGLKKLIIMLFGIENFWVVMCYNWLVYYVLVVIELG